MRNLLTIVLVSLSLATMSFAKTPSSDWQAVEDIPAGWRMAVVAGFTYPCIFVHASDDELICRVPKRRWDEENLPETHVRRDRIREIRVDRRSGSNALLGGGFGGGTGAIFGAIASASARGRAAYGFGVIGILMGARIGNDVHLLKGKVIYRASPVTKQSKAPDPVQMSQIADAIVRSAP